MNLSINNGLDGILESRLRSETDGVSGGRAAHRLLVFGNGKLEEAEMARGEAAEIRAAQRPNDIAILE